ncbi:MAG TPA: Sec-independent protein translocase protein TatB [Hyphomicrobiaceae bacterium]|nr:Sec-independent protein translocase protein TatB [Hyphomicrobiaceae bacterium]
MFDLTSSKLLILGIVALIVVGPKDLPILLRTIGKYVGMIRRHAADFRAQFDEAMRETELDSIKKQVENVGRDVEQTMRDAQSNVEREMRLSEAEIDSAITSNTPASTPGPSDLPAALQPPAETDVTIANAPTPAPAAETAKTGT